VVGHQSLVVDRFVLRIGLEVVLATEVFEMRVVDDED
jgi:hypothetical protein